ncbi:MAG TPA: VWA domain-containing protein, partial [Gemmataceae bacterium]|nr:VWA domain-containing protein [Gemmataceae bacterium]
EAKQRSQEAARREQAAAEIGAILAKTKATLEETQGRLYSAQGLAESLEKDRDETQLRLTQASSRITELTKALAAQSADAKDRLAKKSKELEEMLRDKAALQNLLRQKETLAAESRRSADDLAALLRQTQARVKQLQMTADLVPGLREDAVSSKEKLATAQARLQTLEDELTDQKKELSGSGRTLTEANRVIESLKEDKRALEDQVVRSRLAADNRFAGIALTGRRVIFLVDMSGSMELVDENTTAPDKWAGVRETLAKVMRSLPDLEKFQVILFSDRISYLVGNDGNWLDFDPRNSVDQVTRSLAAIKPRGNTDMHVAFEAAFRFRQQGLDTIYVFSDGLPNIGAGLSPEAARTLKESDRSEILSKYIRQKLRTEWNRAYSGRPKVRINAVGFFYESPDVGAFLWALARENDGSFVGMSKP